MNYALGYATNSKDLFKNFKTKRLDVKPETCKKYLGNNHKEILAAKIWRSCVDLVLNDIINNGAIFKLPTLGKDVEMYIKGISGDKFVEARQNGKWEDVDYLASNFTGYLPVFRFQRAGYIVEKSVYVDPKHKKLLTELVNKGKGYCE